MKNYGKITNEKDISTKKYIEEYALAKSGGEMSGPITFQTHSSVSDKVAIQIPANEDFVRCIGNPTSETQDFTNYCLVLGKNTSAGLKGEPALWFQNSTGNTSAGVMRFNGIATPTQKNDATNKEYVDSGRVWYGTCNTAASTVEKTVTCTGFVLTTGARINVNFTYNNTAANFTLNVNGTGAKSVVKYGTTAVETYRWRALSTVCFTYNGTSWVIDNGTADTSYYGVTKLSNNIATASSSVAATSAAVNSVRAIASAYATCSTAAATIDKVATLSSTSISSLYTGQRVQVFFSATNTATSPTLNVSGTGAKPIVYNNATLTAINSNILRANTTIEFVYDGTNWRIVDATGLLDGSGTIYGNLRLKKVNSNYGCYINFGDGSYCQIYEDSDDTLTIKGSRLNLKGQQSVANTETTPQYRGIQLNTATPTSLINGVVSFVYA